MRRIFRIDVAAFALLTLVPATVFAQASITGLVTDSSGGVLPGVTVEASSPALIEKVRTAVTDGAGQYRIIDLRPGRYDVRFTLPGFSAVLREGIELSGSFTATVDAALRVGALEETITVTGETPIVDVQSARRQQVLQSDVVTAIPSARGANALVNLMPGVVSTETNVILNPGASPRYTVHGGPLNEGRMNVDGINVGAPLNGGGTSGYVTDVGNATEVTFMTSGGLAEMDTGGAIMNIVPRTGGNTRSGSLFVTTAGSWSQGSNFTQELRDAGLTTPPELLGQHDISFGTGGPVWQDRLWYFGTFRSLGSANAIPGMFANMNAGDPTKWTYEPDLSRPARSDTRRDVYALRLTAQVTPRNKGGVFWDEQPLCSGTTWTDAEDGCRKPRSGWISGGSTTASPETATYTNTYQRVQQATWTSTVTSRLLLEANYGTYINRGFQGQERPGNLTRDLIRVVEQAGSIPGLTYRSQNWAANRMWANHWKAAASYVTGAHSMKFGYQATFHIYDASGERFTNNHRLQYRLNNGVPNQLTMLSGPYYNKQRTRGDAFYAQEQWTAGRLTLQGGVRYEHAWSYSPPMEIGPDRFLPNALVFPRMVGVTGFHDIVPRFGAAYNLFGTGKTSLKVNVGKYLQAASNGDRYNATNPASRVAVTTTRSWTDRNANFLPDCNLLNPATNDECGPWANQNFGREVFSTTLDPAILEGWGVRPWDGQFGVSVQHELLTRTSIEVGYHRRWWGNLDVTYNRAVAAQDFDQFSIVAPLDPRLPDGGGYVIDDLWNVTPDKFGIVDNYRTLARNVGKQIEYWQGVDVNISARLRGGLTFQGGTSTGRTVRDLCDVLPKVDDPSRRHCDRTLPYTTQVKALGAYTIPRIDVQLSGTFQSNPGLRYGAGSDGVMSGLAADWNVPNAVVAQTLGRPLAGGAANVTVNLLDPDTMFHDRVNQVDFRVAKILRFGRTRTNVGMDLFNALNSSAVIDRIETFGPRWLTPSQVLSARFVKFSIQVDF